MFKLTVDGAGKSRGSEAFRVLGMMIRLRHRSDLAIAGDHGPTLSLPDRRRPATAGPVRDLIRISETGQNAPVNRR